MRECERSLEGSHVQVKGMAAVGMYQSKNLSKRKHNNNNSKLDSNHMRLLRDINITLVTNHDVSSRTLAGSIVIITRKYARNRNV